MTHRSSPPPSATQSCAWPRRFSSTMRRLGPAVTSTGSGRSRRRFWACRPDTLLPRADSCAWGDWPNVWVATASRGSSSAQFATKERAMALIAQDRHRFLNVGEAAAYVGVSAASLRKWSNQGFVPVYRTPGGQRRFVRRDLDEFLRAMRQQPAG